MTINLCSTILHNGEYLAKTSKGSKTFRVKTITTGSHFKGKRIIYVKTNPGEQFEFTCIGFIRDDGTLQTWKVHQGTIYEKMVAAFLTIYFKGIPGCSVEELTRYCRKCNRPLEDPISYEMGMGKNCRENP
jgi:hypothetical protein